MVTAYNRVGVILGTSSPAPRARPIFKLLILIDKYHSHRHVEVLAALIASGKRRDRLPDGFADGGFAKRMS